MTCWKTVIEPASELMIAVQQGDPVQSQLHMDLGSVVTVWTDASFGGINLVFNVDGHFVEDALWLQKEVNHLPVKGCSA